jgi:putative tryptophan/tyrosine transport system substrate-binding protein
MQRRVLLFGGVAATALITRAPIAQERRSLPRIGLLFAGGASETSPARKIVLSLAERGYVNGKSAIIEERYAYGSLERLPGLARELVALPVDVIVAVPAVATVAAREATATIPIVMVHGGDAKGAGLIESLAHPGGNVTGTISIAPEVAAKGIELLRELVPTIRRLGVLFVPSNIGAPQGIKQAGDAARSLNLELTIVGVERPSELEEAFTTFARARADAVFVLVEPMLFTSRFKLMDLSARWRLPAMYQHGDVVREGGLIGYGPVFDAHYPLAADYVHKILKGAKPATLPVEQSSRFELVINSKTAKELGITIPPTLLLRADEVVE